MTSNSSEIGALKAVEENVDPEEFEDTAIGPVEEEDMEEASGSSTPNSGSLTWIAWFCSLPGHEYFVEVSEDFIEDDFNLTGLNGMVPFWKEALEMVLDIEPEDSHKIPDVSIVESSAELLYGLVHQRYIVTRAGLQAMYDKYDIANFGTCPRVYCYSSAVVPCGRSDLPGLEFVKLYCPNCNDIFTPASSRYQSIDGAFFGTTFPHLFFHTYRDIAPAPFYPSSAARAAFAGTRSPSAASAPPQTPVFHNPNPHGGQKMPLARVYTPKIFGFRVSERARSGPRMRWLRTRPESLAELDHVDWRGRWIGTDGYDEDDDEDQVMEDQEEDDDQDDDGEEEEEEEEEDEPPAATAPPPAPPRSSKPGRRLAMGVDYPSLQHTPRTPEGAPLMAATSPLSAYIQGQQLKKASASLEDNMWMEARRRDQRALLDAYDEFLRKQTSHRQVSSVDDLSPASETDVSLNTPAEDVKGDAGQLAKHAVSSRPGMCLVVDSQDPLHFTETRLDTFV